MRRTHSNAALLVALFLTAACDSATGPSDALDVSLRVLDGPDLIISTEGSAVSFECTATIEAAATGRGRADFTRARRRTYRELDRSQATDSVEFTGGDLTALSLGTVTATTPDTAVLRSFGNQPFSVEYVLWYRVRGAAADDSVAQRLDCGPAVAPGAAPPSITLVELTATAAEIEEGDELLVRYRVEGGAPLWQTSIRFSGAFVSNRIQYEELSLARERELRVVVPSSTLETPIVLTIITADAGGRADTSVHASALTVIDATPPSINDVDITPGQFHVGSEFRITALGSDERRLAHLVWEFGAPLGVRDSIAAELSGSGVIITVLPEWAGHDATLRVWLRDHGNNYSEPYVSVVDGFRFHPVAVTPALTSGTLATLHDVVYDAPRGRLYAVDTDAALLRAFDIASMTLAGTLALPAWPGAADMTVSGDSLLITQSELRALSVIDLNTMTSLGAIALPPVDSIALAEAANPPLPTGVRVLANGKALVKLHKKAVGGYNTVEVTLQSGESRLRTESTGGSGSVTRWWDRMAVSPDRSRLVVFDPGCARAYVSASDTFSACATPDPGDLAAARISFGVDLSRVMIGGAVFTTDLVPVATVPYTVTHLLPDGVHALAVAGDWLLRVRITDGRITSRMMLGFGPSRLILLEDGHTLLLFASDAAFVARVDIAGMM